MAAEEVLVERCAPRMRLALRGTCFFRANATPFLSASGLKIAAREGNSLPSPPKQKAKRSEARTATPERPPRAPLARAAGIPSVERGP